MKTMCYSDMEDYCSDLWMKNETFLPGSCDKTEILLTNENSVVTTDIVPIVTVDVPIKHVAPFTLVFSDILDDKIAVLMAMTPEHS